MHRNSVEQKRDARDSCPLAASLSESLCAGSGTLSLPEHRETRDSCPLAVSDASREPPRA